MSLESSGILTQLESLLASPSVGSQASAQFVTSALRCCDVEPASVAQAPGAGQLVLCCEADLAQSCRLSELPVSHP